MPVLICTLSKFVSENGHRDFVLPEHNFVFWQHKIPVTVYKHKVCVAVTQTFLECGVALKFLDDIFLNYLTKLNAIELRVHGFPSDQKHFINIYSVEGVYYCRSVRLTD
jgi:hypothetical protein